MSERITLLPGDGIGPEITEATVQLLDSMGDFHYRQGLIGGAAMDVHDGDPFPPETEELVRNSDVILLGAVGGPKWASTDPEAQRPEDGLLKLRQAARTHANLRPVFPINYLQDLSVFRPKHVEGVNFVIVRELLGGSYFGESGREGNSAFDVREYRTDQVEAVGRTAFELALERAEKTDEKPHLTNVDKANVLETSRLWREVIEELHKEYPDVELEHLYVDNAAFQIGKRPKDFDVLVTENEHGDILSDEAALIPGSLGLMPSASVGTEGPAIFEPVHGSAPDIAGKGIANPTAMFYSAAMALEHLGRPHDAESIAWAVSAAFRRKMLTQDLDGDATTEDFTQRVIRDRTGYAARQ